MDNSQKPTPKPFTDVARPGATPANPSSRPIITAHTPEQKDPMMTSVPVSDSPVRVSSPSPASEPVTQPMATTPATEPTHKFRHDEGHIGHVGKRPVKKNKIIIAVLVTLSIGIAFYIMFIRT
jgi:hypothetical protein